MQRVMIIGSPGAGKSTLGRQLAARTGLPLRHLDAEYWQPGWTEREPDEWMGKLAALVAEDAWIIDGNYGSSLPTRLARADTVIHLDYPTHVCLWRAAGRVAASHGQVRADSAPGCPERFDAAFLGYIALFRRRKRARIMRHLDQFGGTIVRFRRPSEADRWLAQQAAGR